MTRCIFFLSKCHFGSTRQEANSKIYSSLRKTKKRTRETAEKKINKSHGF